MPLPLPDPMPPCEPTAEIRSAWQSGLIPTGGVYACFAVAAPHRSVFDLLADDARMSTWIPRLSRSTVLAAVPPPDPATACNRVAFATQSPIGEITWELDRCHRFEEGGGRIWWDLAAGDRFSTIRGGYWLSPLPDGATLVRYWSEVVAAAPVPISVQEQVARIGLGDLVGSLRRQLTP